MKTSHPFVDYSALVRHFKPSCVRLKKRIMLERDQEQYPTVIPAEDQDYYRNDWTAFAFRAFLRLVKDFRLKVDSFCTIGTGVGLDVLLAIETFSPRAVFMTDLTTPVAQIAKRNVFNNLRKPLLYERRRDGSGITEIGCRLFEDKEVFAGAKFDLIYENLPVLPLYTLDRRGEPYQSASFASVDDYPSPPQSYVEDLLFTHYEFLVQAKRFLNPAGAVLCNIGARIQKDKILEMFDYLGYDTQVVVYDLKRQTEADSNLPAYKKCSDKTGVNFYFYSYDVIKAFCHLPDYDVLGGLADSWSRRDIQKMLGEHKLSISEALERQNQNLPVAHEVMTILGVPKK
jgi:methylase of polypeptide subunit release factors